MIKNNRSLSVDITKGVAIIAIVLGHVTYSCPTCKLLDSSVLFYGLWHVFHG